VNAYARILLHVPLLFVFLLLVSCDEKGTPEAQERPPPAQPAPPADAEPEEKREPRVRAFSEQGLDPPEARAARKRLVENGVVAQGVKDDGVIAAMRRVPRHLFVPEARRRHAYENRPLPIGWDQTISQPYIVASMTEEIRPKHGDKILEIGTGSGYQAAVLAEITPHVWSIEIKEPLATRAAKTLRDLGYDEVEAKHGDGYYGWKEKGPFDAIVVTAAAPHIPPPLVQQLKPGGRLVIPVGRPMAVQALKLVTKDERGRVRSKDLYPVRFVPLTGSLGAVEED
jgi:protein-L-isoaspartate(D-aspartate) O-methyltransferase